MKLDKSREHPPFAHSVKDGMPFVALDFLIALSPCILWGVFRFGIKALLCGLFCIFAACLTEGGYCFFKKTSFDFSVAVSALIFSMCLASTAPLYLFPVGGGLIGALYIVRRFSREYFTCQPAVIALTVVCLFMFHTSSPLDSVLSGMKPADLTVAELILGVHSGGWGSVSFLCIFAGYLYLALRKRIRWWMPLLFFIALILGVCLFYTSTDLVTQLDYISYLVFDGRIAFAAVFMLTMPNLLPRFSKSEAIGTALLGIAFGYMVVTLKSCDTLYPLLGLCGILSRPLNLLYPRILGLGKASSKKREQ